MNKGIPIDYTRLRKEREKLGLSMSAVARAIGVSVSAYSLWEKNKVKPIKKYVKLLNDFFEYKFNLIDIDVEPLRLNPKSLKKIRLSCGYTAEKVSKLVDVGISCVLNWEAGRHHPSDKKLEALMELFGIGILIGEEDFLEVEEYIDIEVFKNVDEWLDWETQKINYAHQVMLNKV